VRENTHTLDELLRLLTDDPVSTVDIRKLKAREEAPNDGDRLITNIVTLCAPDKQRALLEAHLLRVVEGEIRHGIETLAQRVDGDAPRQWLARLGAHEVGQQELAHGKLLRIGLHDLVGVLLGLWLGLGDALHALGVLGEIARQRGVDGCVVDGDDVGAAVRVAQRHGHDGLCAHRVPDERGVLEVVFREEGFDVFGEGRVVVRLVVRRFAVVARVDGVDGAAEDARKGTLRSVV
jgi:hypothetical protein